MKFTVLGFPFVATPTHSHIDIHVDKIDDNLMLHLNQLVVECTMYHKIYIHKDMYKINVLIYTNDT